MTDANTLKTKPTPELETLMALIEGILADREDASRQPINVGDSVSFDLRKGCTVEGVVVGKTDKRVKVSCSKIGGIYQIATKNVVLESSAPVVAESEEEE